MMDTRGDTRICNPLPTCLLAVVEATPSAHLREVD